MYGCVLYMQGQKGARDSLGVELRMIMNCDKYVEN